MRALLTTIVGLLFVSAIANGAAEPVVTLNNISVEADDKFSAVTLRLSAKPVWKKITPTIHGTFAQFDLPQTFVTNPGKFVEGAGDFILKTVAFQTNETDAALRVFLSEDSPKDAKHWKADVLDQRLVITFDHPKTAAPSIVAATTPASKETPASLLQKAESKGSNFAAFDSKLKGSLRKVSIFAAFGLLLIIGLFVFRPRLRGRNRGKTQDEEPLIKNLATQSLAHKQTISLVEVAGEKLLLSVTPSGVQFLTAIQKPQPSLPPQLALTQSQPMLTPTTSGGSGKDLLMKAQQPAVNSPKPQITSQKMLQQAKKIKKIKSGNTSTNKDGNTATVNDVTQMIRERLKGLQQIG